MKLRYKKGDLVKIISSAHSGSIGIKCVIDEVISNGLTSLPYALRPVERQPSFLLNDNLTLLERFNCDELELVEDMNIETANPKLESASAVYNWLEKR